MNRSSFQLVFVLMVITNPIIYSQADTAYSFIVAGHTYGAHGGTNPGLHTPFLDRIYSGIDNNTLCLIFTGDLVRSSTPETWQQIENELDLVGLPYYYSMGNHDADEDGYDVFEEKFGSTCYTFTFQSELFIILNSTEEERSISDPQLQFLDSLLNNADAGIENVFIFFHEILWNSHEKYAGVNSNSRSRHDQISGYSNFWEEVYPVLQQHQEKKIFITGGDVGGNTDAIPAFYDTWGHITLLASGMGEVPDENYMVVDVNEDTVSFRLIPLNTGVTLSEIQYYSVPGPVGDITGPVTINQGDLDIQYSVSEVFNATSYSWELPDGSTGSSTDHTILLDFDNLYGRDTLSVRAVRDLFGSGPPSSLIISSINYTSVTEHSIKEILDVRIVRSDASWYLKIVSNEDMKLVLEVIDLRGRVLYISPICVTRGYTEAPLDISGFTQQIVCVRILGEQELWSEKIYIE